MFYYSDASTGVDQMDVDSESEESGDDAVRSVRVTGVNNTYYSEPCIDETPASTAYYCTASTCFPLYSCIEHMCNMTAAVYDQMAITGPLSHCS